MKANASKLTWRTPGLGAVSQLCGMLFQKTIGTELTAVPYQGTAPALNALLGGQVDILCDQTTQTLPHIKAGTVKLYGVTTTVAHQVAARHADARRAGPQGLRGHGLARHLRAQGHAGGGDRQVRRARCARR